MKFINWTLIGGLAVAIFFCGSDLAGQAKSDSLYNPFHMKNERVPLAAMRFGFNETKRLKSEEAINAIQRAFSDAGIELEKDTFLKDVGFVVDGYSVKDNIGFVYLDYTNMDETFPDDAHNRLKWLGGDDFSLEVGIKEYEECIEKMFGRFLKYKESFIKNIRNRTSPKPEWYKKRYADQLSTITPIEANKALFSEYFLEYILEDNRNYLEKDKYKGIDYSNHTSRYSGYHPGNRICNRNHMVSDTGFIIQFREYIDVRLEDSVEKLVLLNYTSYLRRFIYKDDNFFNKITEAFNEQKKLKSDKKFTERIVSIAEFLNHHYYILLHDKNYQALKLDIMNSYSPKDWINKLDRLDEYHNRKLASIDEIRQVENKAKVGTRFIAPIFWSDSMMIVPKFRGYPLPDSLVEKKRKIEKEFNEKNGTTLEFYVNKNAEGHGVLKRHFWDKEGTKEQQDSIRRLWRKELNAIDEKYKAMELLSNEEKEEYQSKIIKVEGEIENWRKEEKESIRPETIRKLEENVKIYIKWAKSQMN